MAEGDRPLAAQAHVKTVTVKRVTASPLYKAWIDGEDLSFSNDATSAAVEAGRHALTWVVHGPAGQKYGITIVAPKEAHFDYTATFDGSEKDAGLHWFEVSA
jgi:hypothetical protein